MPIRTDAHLLDGAGFASVTQAAGCRALTQETKVATSAGSPFSSPIPKNAAGKQGNLARRLRVQVRNSASTQASPPNRTVYVGGPDVSVDNGYPLEPGQRLPLVASSRLQLYAIKAQSSFGTIPLNTLELS